MKNLPCVLAAAAVTIVAGCAAPQASVEPASATAAARSSSYYCAKERLAADGDRLECNWQPTADEACKFGDTRILQRVSLASDPQPAGRCNTGQWLVRVSPR
jgi:hypothetical protein